MSRSVFGVPGSAGALVSISTDSSVPSCARRGAVQAASCASVASLPGRVICLRKRSVSPAHAASSAAAGRPATSMKDRYITYAEPTISALATSPRPMPPQASPRPRRPGLPRIRRSATTPRSGASRLPTGSTDITSDAIAMRLQRAGGAGASFASRTESLFMASWPREWARRQWGRWATQWAAASGGFRPAPRSAAAGAGWAAACPAPWRRWLSRTPCRVRRWR